MLQMAETEKATRTSWPPPSRVEPSRVSIGIVSVETVLITVARGSWSLWGLVPLNIHVREGSRAAEVNNLGFCEMEKIALLFVQ